MNITPIKFDASDLEHGEYNIEKVLQRPDSYMHFGRKETFVTWSIGPVVLTRDSEIIDQANYRVLVASLKAAEAAGDIEPESYEITRASHWAVGWVDHLSFMARAETGEPTKVGHWVHAWLNMLSEYPSADDDVLSEMESKASFEAVKSMTSMRPFGIELTDEQTYDVLRLLEENDSLRGEYPDESRLREALVELKVLAEDGEEE